MKIVDLLNSTVESFKNADLLNPRLDAEVLLSCAMHKEREYLLVHDNKSVANEELQIYQKYVKRRLKNEPVAYITGSKEFYSLDFHVNKQVLIPRPETEILIDLGMYYSPLDAKVVDIGTGSGAIAVALKYNRKDLTIWATDISEKAIRVAKKNATAITGKNSIVFKTGDLFEPLQKEKFDVIISNPPYVDRNEENLQKDIFFEPEMALFAEKDGSAVIQRLIKECKKYLEKKGTLIIEIGATMKERVIELANKNGFDATVLNDYAGLPRVAILKRTENKLNC